MKMVMDSIGPIWILKIQKKNLKGWDIVVNRNMVISIH